MSFLIKWSLIKRQKKVYYNIFNCKKGDGRDLSQEKKD